ncbi:MAG: EAL domain-containing protein [Methyloversatilis sp.]|nr:EAL domain-containing protein [Methyloversatilis sp.]
MAFVWTPLDARIKSTDPEVVDSRAFRIGLVAISGLLLLALWLLPGTHPLRVSRDLFPVALHTVMESASIAVSVMVFAVVWHAYRPERPANVVIIACGFLAVALLDFAHAMSYRGMPDFFTPSSPQKAISFWLCARIVAGLTLVHVSFAPWRPFAHPAGRYACLAASLAGVAALYVLLLAHIDLVPLFFVEGEGLTAVKVALEAFAMGLMLLVIVRLWGRRGQNAVFDVDGLITAALMLVLTSLSLVLYVNVNDVFSLLGHVYKVAAFYIIYRVVFIASVRQPYRQLAVEIAAREAAQQQVRTLEYVDPLTGLPNRAQLRDSVLRGLAAPRSGGGLALMIINIDGFTQINDAQGHAFGDSVLKVVAERLAQQSKSVGGAFRLDADEFAVLIDDVPAAPMIDALADRLERELAQPMVLPGNEVSVTVSIGIARAPEHAETFDALLQNAGTALHKAKSRGTGRWLEYHPTMNVEVVARVGLRAGLRRALERHEFLLYYQPQFDLASGAVVGVEALVRWQHPQEGIISPARFIPEAEDCGLIVPISEWVLGEACRQAVAFRELGPDIPRVAVNLSARQFEHEPVDEVVARALESSGLPASMLELELTESILVRDTESVLATLQRLRALGVRLSIDDFGTGYSSLAYLHAFPIDKLKIDQSFIRDLHNRPDSEAIVATILQLARSLGMTTVAEGVENEAAAAVLRRLGCMQAQGYLYARPMPAAELFHFVRAMRE